MDAQFNNRCSRFWFTLFFMFMFATVDHVASAEREQRKDPEAVYVAVEQARLYAGPSSDFYPTGMAKRGVALEVYHRTENGWLGVRPPQGSFSWVPASQAYLLPGGRVIEITDANSVSWIGTDLGSAKQYRWQVQLKVGEQLSVLGEASIKSDVDDREALWYKVSPPAGEFRWIEQAAVSKNAPQVKPTSGASETQVAAKADEKQSEEAHSRDSQVAALKSKASESSVVERKKRVAELPSVQSASFESPVANETRSPSRSVKLGNTNATNSGKGNSQRLPQDDQWDGWYAFEMGAKGVRTPFLDKLSGRDRGQQTKSTQASTVQHDPLIHDPFSLAMASESPRISAPETLPRGKSPSKTTPDASNSVAKKQREWRDPRSLREARQGSASERIGSLDDSQGSIAARSASNSTSNVLTASSDNLPSGNEGEVNTAGYDQNEMPRVETASAGSPTSVNWYGLSESNLSNQTSPASKTALNVVTSGADVGDLQVALNNAVSSSNGPWNLAPLAERARYLIEHGPTAIDRGQARLLLERIDAFQNVSARSQQLNGTTPLQTSPVQSTSFNAGTNNLSLPNSPQTPSATYDATGWLVPVHAAGPDQPTHALTNDTGDVIAYVSPIAGLNLDRYRNQAVGINGLRGYLPQLKAAHIQAQRVSRVR